MNQSSDWEGMSIMSIKYYRYRHQPTYSQIQQRNLEASTNKSSSSISSSFPSSMSEAWYNKLNFKLNLQLEVKAHMNQSQFTYGIIKSILIVNVIIALWYFVLHMCRSQHKHTSREFLWCEAQMLQILRLWSKKIFSLH